jgi:hypothetical protein
MPRFRNKDGSLTKYSFMCGYIQQKEYADGLTAKMHHEGGCYHIKLFGPDHRRILWLVAPNLTLARKVFSNIRELAVIETFKVGAANEAVWDWHVAYCNAKRERRQARRAARTHVTSEGNDVGSPAL